MPKISERIVFHFPTEGYSPKSSPGATPDIEVSIDSVYLIKNLQDGHATLEILMR